MQHIVVYLIFLTQKGKIKLIHKFIHKFKLRFNKFKLIHKFLPAPNPLVKLFCRLIMCCIPQEQLQKLFNDIYLLVTYQRGITDFMIVCVWGCWGESVTLFGYYVACGSVLMMTDGFKRREGLTFCGKQSVKVVAHYECKEILNIKW